MPSISFKKIVTSAFERKFDASNHQVLSCADPNGNEPKQRVYFIRTSFGTWRIRHL